MSIELPNGNYGLSADVGVLHYHVIQGSKLALDSVVSGLFGVSIPPSPDIRFIPFAVTEFGGLGGHATYFSNELAKQEAASKGMHVGKLLASWRRKISLAVHVAHTDNVLRGLSAVADCGEAASSSVGVPSLATAFVTRAMGRKRSRASSRGP
jgi:hypothetical protein